MKFYTSTLKILKMNSFTKKEKIIVFFDWVLNAIVKIVFLPLCLLGAIFSLLEEIFDLLSEFFWDLTNWLDGKNISFVSEKTTALLVKKFVEELNNKNKIEIKDKDIVK